MKEEGGEYMCEGKVEDLVYCTCVHISLHLLLYATQYDTPHTSHSTQHMAHTTHTLTPIPDLPRSLSSPLSFRTSLI